MAHELYALSLKQPWAALLALGLKTIEIRSWPTNRRGRVLIHAARVPDARGEAWAKLSEDLLVASRARGGVIAEAELCECRIYRSRNAFLADRHLHLNEPDWFRGPVMYGFVFRNASLVPFRSYPGNVRFFRVPPEAARS